MASRSSTFFVFTWLWNKARHSPLVRLFLRSLFWVVLSVGDAGSASNERTELISSESSSLKEADDSVLSGSAKWVFGGTFSLLSLRLKFRVGKLTCVDD